MFNVMKEGMSPAATAWFTDVFLIIFEQQWSSMEQRDKIRLCLHRQYLSLGLLRRWLQIFCGNYLQ